jgi:acetyl-CoA carboxylase biotin carboxyl carrier protein
MSALPTRVEVRAEMVASVHTIVGCVGEAVAAGDTLVILESMKMEIPVLAEAAGFIVEISVKPGDVIHEGDLIAVMDSGRS